METTETTFAGKGSWVKEESAKAACERRNQLFVRTEKLPSGRFGYRYATIQSIVRDAANRKTAAIKARLLVVNEELSSILAAIEDEDSEAFKTLVDAKFDILQARKWLS